MARRPAQFELDRSSPLACGLVSWFPLRSLADRDMSLRRVGHLRWTTAAINGADPQRGQLVEWVEATDARAIVDASVVPATLPLTVGVWIKQRATGDQQDICSCTHTTDDSTFYDGAAISVLSGDTIRCHVGNGGAAAGTNRRTLVSNAAYAVANQWLHITFVRRSMSANDGTIYVNGDAVAATESGTASSYAAGDRFKIGQGWGTSGNDPFDGWMSDLCVWNRALSTAEIRLLADPSKHALVRPVTPDYHYAVSAAPPSFAGSNLILGGGVI